MLISKFENVLRSRSVPDCTYDFFPFEKTIYMNKWQRLRRCFDYKKKVYSENSICSNLSSQKRSLASCSLFDTYLFLIKYITVILLT